MSNLASRMWNWVKFLFSPFGWIGRADFLRGAFIVVMLNLCSAGLISYAIKELELTLLGVLVTLPISISVMAKRLHALGCTGWLQAPSRGLVTAGLMGQALLPHSASSEMSPAMMAALIALALGLVIDLGMFIWLSVSPDKRLTPIGAAAPG